MNYTEDLKKYLCNISTNEYYNIIVIEDLVRYFGFSISDDNCKYDIRTIKLSNAFSDTIVISATIISFYDEPYVQSNNLMLENVNTKRIFFHFFGKYYKRKHNFLYNYNI